MKKRTILTSLLLLANIVTLFAQGSLPCNDGDPDGVACPIDTWVVAFAAIALIFTVLHLRGREKNTPILPNN
ncbi:MAG: hypothetical protein V4619_14565 [Bacteroidota bacterium]